MVGRGQFGLRMLNISELLTSTCHSESWPPVVKPGPRENYKKRDWELLLGHF